MNKFAITLPTKQHNGTSNLRHINRIKKAILAISGGYSEYKQVGGAWLDSETGHVYKDTSNIVFTYCNDQQLLQLRELVPTWGVWLQQIAVTIEISQVYVDFVECTREQDLAS